MAGQLSVAFFRNLNLGQARSKSPTTPQLLDAFRNSGAERALNFQTNGTVIFAAEQPEAVAAGARARLGEVTGYRDAVVVRSAAWVLDLGRRLDPQLPNGEVALFDAAAVPTPSARSRLPGPLAVVELDHDHAVTSWGQDWTGSPSNPALTGVLGVPVTCRGVPTMLRLARRLADLTDQEAGVRRRPATPGPA